MKKILTITTALALLALSAAGQDIISCQAGRSLSQFPQGRQFDYV